MICVLATSRTLITDSTTWMQGSCLWMNRLKLSRIKSLIFSLLMKKNEGKTTDWLSEQSIVFLLLYLVFKFLSFCCCCFNSDVIKIISCFISYLCLFVKTNRGRYMMCLSFIFYLLKQFRMSNIFWYLALKYITVYLC